MIGGGVYEALVLVPIWASAPPDSVLAFHQHGIANPEFVTHQGGKFWIFVTPMLGILSIATILSGFKANTHHRKWRIVGATLSLVLIIFTFAWFIPNVLLLTGEEVTKMSRDRIVSLTNWWVGLNWLRAVIYVIAWVMGLRALMIPAERAKVT